MIASPRSALRNARRILSAEGIEWLVTPHSIDRYTEMVNPVWSRTKVRAKVVSAKRQTPRSVTLELRPNSNWKGFSAGAHIPVIVEIDGVSQLRYYSPANAEHERDRIELTVTAHDGGAVSQYLVEHAHAGMVVRIGPAENDFGPGAARSPMLLISGGSGITPVMSILRTLLHERRGEPIAFLHYSRSPGETLYHEELRRIALRHENVSLAISYTRENAGPDHLHGHLKPAHIKRLGVDLADMQSYVCGPPSLIDATERMFAKQGLEERLHIERFVLPQLEIDAEATGTLRFADSGITVENSGESILAQAEQAGLTPWAGCRMGICHTCVCDVEDEAAVRDLRTGEIHTVENEQIQICVHAPVGDMNIRL